ncbi:glucosamine-6-phosphate deaminase [Kaistella flava (ex Peng et al. 2021)]|uniref:Glucosamine-6-phosphate deaminase n=1 Tax=Kaistella flava (ex Peng et al. 2021) TaxID=2038776 RepID=A0A7M2YC13_9FLAO|nr:glucosamine-6-phosphate deaminase [Kaistella flava (ex Peng et al. 2021)]QOW11807.1 glucosamine-6-phosphate deaminase [Kaistella flava (ex Peng et al. 2021)]
MRILIKQDENEIAYWTADYLIKKINDFSPTTEKPFVLGLPTGSSPIATYNELIKRYKKGDISFKNVITFNMDEYIGLPEDHPESYHFFMNEKLFKYIDIPAENIHILNSNSDNLENECIEYEQKILKYGGIDLLLGGIGMDGHIAFNEPGSSLTSRTRIKSLCYDTIQANSRFFENDASQVPTKVLTVGVGTIMDAREVLIIVSGYHKARALREVVEGSVNHMWPASILQMHQKCILVCDEPATAELQVKTVKYFKDIERISTDGNHQ